MVDNRHAFFNATVTAVGNSGVQYYVGSRCNSISQYVVYSKICLSFHLSAATQWETFAGGGSVPLFTRNFFWVLGLLLRTAARHTHVCFCFGCGLRYNQSKASHGNREAAEAEQQPPHTGEGTQRRKEEHKCLMGALSSYLATLLQHHGTGFPSFLLLLPLQPEPSSRAAQTEWTKVYRVD